MNRTFWSKLVVITSLQPTFKKTCCPGGWWVADFLKSINPDLATPVWSHLGRAKLKPLWPQEPRPWRETCSHIQMCHWKKLQSRTTQWWRLWWNLLHVHFVKKMIEHEHSNKIRFHHHEDMPCAVPHWTTTWRQTAWGMSLGPRQHICQPKLFAMIYMLRALCIVLQVFNRDYNVDLTVASKAAYMNEYTRRTPPTAKLDFASLVNDPSFWSSALYLMVMACLNHLRSKHLLAGEHTAPENRPSQKESNLLTINFQVFFLFVSGRVIS